VPRRPPPNPLQGRLFQRSGPERFLYVRVSALSTTRPLVVVCLLTNELSRSFVGSPIEVMELRVNRQFHTAGLSLSLDI
jgi:hypothetical protein